MKNIVRLAGTTVATAMLGLTLAACGSSDVTSSSATATDEASGGSVEQTEASESTDSAQQASDSSPYTERDLTQEADLTDAQSIEVRDGEDVSITEEGVYVLSGTAADVTVTVDVDDTEKVQLVLDGVTIENTDAPALYVASADKVFVTTTEESENSLSVSGTFVSDEENDFDAVIYARDDVVLNGLGTLTITSSQNAVSAKDDLKVTGGTYRITCDDQAFDVNNGAYFYDGDMNVEAVNDAIRADETVEIDGGTYVISAREGIESTYVLITGGTLQINASDDAINAGQKSDTGTPTIEVTGGDITIVMAGGDTDAIDANGNIYVRGGTIDITAELAFDFEGEAELAGGTVIVNGEQVSAIENSMMMGGQGGMGGDAAGGPGANMEAQGGR